MWFTELFRGENPSLDVAHSVLVLSIVAFLGLAIGSISFKGIRLGIAGVLFSGLLLGHFKVTISHDALEFCREGGLVLFVYTIGLQVGPGFFASLKRNGLPLNILAGSIVIIGALMTILIFWSGAAPVAAAVGLFSGATTNTPSLGAAQQALRGILPADDPRIALPGVAYAVAYPFGIIGIIVSMLVIKRFFKIDLNAETELLAKLNAGAQSNLETVNLEVKNTNLHGRRISEIPALAASGVVISRMLRAGRPEVAGADSVLQTGDVLLAVGPRKGLDDLRTIVGSESALDLRAVPSDITARRVLITRKTAAGKTLDELQLRERFGVNVTRIHRNEIEIPVTPGLKLQYADNLVVVGDQSSLSAVAKVLGDSPKMLDHPQLIPIVIGIALGVILGNWPINVGLSAPVRLGLAGGPLLVAIILSRLGKIGPLLWYMPLSANYMLREVGIVLFLACVGLKGGTTFVQTLKTSGPLWMLLAACITVVPLLLVGLIGRIFLKTNYLTLCGLLAGSMTDPPALSFATSITGSEAPSIAYATVYPLTMLLRVICAQAIVLLFAH